MSLELNECRLVPDWLSWDISVIPLLLSGIGGRCPVPGLVLFSDSDVFALGFDLLWSGFLLVHEGMGMSVFMEMVLRWVVNVSSVALCSWLASGIVTSAGLDIRPLRERG